MKLIKSKMKLVFLAILVSFGLSISNVWAMEEEEAPQDPQSAAMMAASAAPAAVPVPGMVTPLRSAMRGQVVPQSSAKATIKITNYCRQIIEELNKGNINEVLTLLNSFYKKIPSTLKNSTRKRTKGQNDAAFELQLRQDALNYHKSLFFCLAMCLTMSVNTDDVKTSEELAEKVSHNSDYSKIVVQLCTSNVPGKEKTHLLEFEITLLSDKINIKTSISMLEYSIKSHSLVDISDGYKTSNFFKITTAELAPVSGDLSRSQHLLGGEDETPADPKDGDGLKNRLELIFNAIPASQRVYLEQYYQFLMFSLVNFMGSSLCFAEFITGDGRADLIIRTEKDGKLVGSIIELKRAQTADVALAQITHREYINSFDEEFQIVGISISGRDGAKIVVDCKKRVIEPKVVSIKEADHTSSIQIASSIPKQKTKKIKKADKKSQAPAKKKQKREAEESEEEKSEGEQK